MDQSFHLTTAQVQFMEERLALVHIPRHLYPFFLKPILQILFHEVKPLDENGNEISDLEEEVDELPDDDSTSSTSTTTKKPYQPSFLNISITPVECSVMCPRELAERYFAPLVQQFVASGASPMTFTKDDFIAMQVYGEGLEAGQRVLELTSPLAMAGISIFFVSTYFSDYILVPYRVKTQVIQALEKRGFQFETSTDTFASPNSHHHAQFNRCFSPDRSTTSSLASPPSTPPPSTLDELQSRTFSSLRKNRVVPGVDRSLRLVQCAAHRRYTSTASSISILRDALTTTLIVDEPRFLSLTLAAADPAASLLLEQRLLPRFLPSSFGSNDDGSGAEDETGLLLGAKEDVLIPIMLDLRNLPLEATGIVCGVAGRLAEATHEDLLDERPQPAAAEVAAAATSIATLPSPSSSSTAQSSSLDSYSYMKAVFSSSAGSSTSSDNTSRHRTYPPLPPSTHRLQPDFDAKADTPVEIGFLSTARAGTILVGEHELDRAVLALEAEAGRDGEKSDNANDDETEENVDVNDDDDDDNDDDDDDMV